MRTKSRNFVEIIPIVKLGYTIIFAIIFTLVNVLLAYPGKLSAIAQEESSKGAADALPLIVGCLERGMEAIMHASGPATCEPYETGVALLNKQNVEVPYQTDPVTACRAASGDQRLLPADIVKKILSAKGSLLDPRGIRIIGGVYCDGLDLTGVQTIFSIALDRSVFRKDVNLRNFHSSADFSIENSVAHSNVYILRAEINGSFFAAYSYVGGNLTIANSTIKGAVRVGHALLPFKFNVIGSSVAGDVDASNSYFGYLAIRKNQISGAIDLGQTQARCYYDIRKNEIGDVVLTNFGFGDHTASPGPVYNRQYNYKIIIDEDTGSQFELDPLVQNRLPQSTTANFVKDPLPCVPYDSVSAGTFVFLDNHVKQSLCLRSPRWLDAKDPIYAQSIMYINENAIDGQTWLDLTDRFPRWYIQDPDLSPKQMHDISIFNVRSNTLIMHFSFKDDRARIKVNGLHFDKIYDSNARCEASVSLRSSRPKGKDQERAFEKASIPPDLRLPSTRKVLNWIERNTFKATQPFAEFVNAFEHAGDLDGARDLKTKEAWIDLISDARKVAFIGDDTNESSAGLSSNHGFSFGRPPETKEHVSLLTSFRAWVEDVVKVSFKTILWLLADHGFRPERVGWYVIGTLLLFLVIFHLFIKVVGFSVEDETYKSDPKTYQPVAKLHPVGIIFLFDRMLPAYKIRDKDYKIRDYYVRSRDGNGINFSYLNIRYVVERASPGKARKAETWLSVIRFLGLIYLIFVVAAVGRIVH